MERNNYCSAETRAHPLHLQQRDWITWHKGKEQQTGSISGQGLHVTCEMSWINLRTKHICTRFLQEISFPCSHLFSGMKRAAWTTNFFLKWITFNWIITLKEQSAGNNNLKQSGLLLIWSETCYTATTLNKRAVSLQGVLIQLPVSVGVSLSWVGKMYDSQLNLNACWERSCSHWMQLQSILCFYWDKVKSQN